MRVHIFQHVPFEDVGSISNWLSCKNADVSYSRFFEENLEFPIKLPSEMSELLIILGGPMSVNDEAIFPWLAGEKAFIAAAIANGTAVLGICLGAQLIAASKGANVFQGEEKEIGWLPIEPAGNRDTYKLPATTVFHWHGETFELPKGAARLASSAACKNQAFQLGERVIGLQFHLETTPESAQLLAENCGEELVPGRYIQSKEEILAGASIFGPANNELMADVLDYLTR